MLDANVVGSVLQRLREERGLSQEIVSGLAGIGRTHLSAIERGERKPTLETFYRIGEALHMRPSAVLAEIEAELDKRCPRRSQKDAKNRRAAALLFLLFVCAVRRHRSSRKYGRPRLAGG